MTPNPKPDNFIEWAVRRNLKYLDCESANRQVVLLTIETVKLQAEIDALKMKLKEKDNED